MCPSPVFLVGADNKTISLNALEEMRNVSRETLLQEFNNPATQGDFTS
jgi:hypothetical protein